MLLSVLDFFGIDFSARFLASCSILELEPFIFPNTFVTFWSWSCRFNGICSILEFEPFIFDGICNILPLAAFMQFPTRVHL